MLSADLAALFCDWQPRKQAVAVYRVYWICPETSPPQCVHTQLLLSFLTFLKKLGKKKETSTIEAQAAVTALKWRFFEAGCS